MKQQELNERILDEIIKYAVSNNAEQAANEWPSEEELSTRYRFSESFDNKMQNLFAQQKRSEKLAQVKLTTLKMAAGILIFLSVSFVTVMNVDALRVSILNFISELREDSTKVSIDGDYGKPTELQGEIIPSYLPEGFENILFDTSEGYYIAIYRDKDGNEIMLEKLPSGSSAGVDSEGAYIEQMIVNKQNAEYFEKNNISTLLYRYDGKVLLLRTTLPKTEVVNIAESMTYQK